MKTNTSKPSPLQKEDISTNEQFDDQRLMDSLKKVLENTTQVISNNKTVIQTSAKLAATNESLTSTVELLSAANQTLAATNEKILNCNKSGDEPDAENQKDESPCTSRKDWKYHYSVLKEDKRNDPLKAVTRFVQIDSLFGQRENLLLFFWGAMQSPLFEGDDAETKGDRISFYVSLLDLIEGVYRVVEMIKNEELIFSCPNSSKGC